MASFNQIGSHNIHAKRSVFLYNCQPRGYISEGERAIDIQSEQAATLHDYNQGKFCHNITKIGLNRLRMGTRIFILHYRENEGEKGKRPLGASNPQPCAPQVRDL